MERNNKKPVLKARSKGRVLPDMVKEEKQKTETKELKINTQTKCK